MALDFMMASGFIGILVNEFRIQINMIVLGVMENSMNSLSECMRGEIIGNLFQR